VIKNILYTKYPRKKKKKEEKRRKKKKKGARWKG